MAVALSLAVVVAALLSHSTAAASSASASRPTVAPSWPPPSKATAGKAFFTSFTDAGRPLHGGGDEWELISHVPVTNQWGGLVIGNVGKGTRLMIERYMYNKDAHEEATYGWGYLLHGDELFGGWVGNSSCGWFPLQRDFNGRPSTRAVQHKIHRQHHQRCEPTLNGDGVLAPQAIQNRHSMSDWDNTHMGEMRLVQTIKDCPLHLNYDRQTRTFRGRPLATLPADTLLHRRYVVEGPEEHAALVRTLEGFDADGWSGWWFTDASCLSINVKQQLVDASPASPASSSSHDEESKPEKSEGAETEASNAQTAEPAKVQVQEKVTSHRRQVKRSVGTLQPPTTGSH